MSIFNRARILVALFLLGVAASVVADDKILFLADETEVLKARYELLSHETEEVFSIYYLWDGNRVGAAALAAHREAAKNGARVRIIIDGLSGIQTGKLPYWVRKKLEAVAPLNNIPTSMMQALLEDGVEIRIFNPLRLNSLKSLKFPRINTRTHDKISFFKQQKIADIGDRNWQAVNFRMAKGKAKAASYRSAETFFSGDAVSEVEKYLNKLWDEPEWVMKPDLSKVDPAAVLADRRYLERLSKLTKKKLGTPASTLLSKMISVEELEFMHDVPGFKRKLPGMEVPLLEQIRSARRKITMISPYIVLTEDFKKAVLEARKNHIEIDIITPSFATTDAPLASAAFDQQARELLDAGVRIYQHQGPDFLHAKMMLIDDDTAIITTHNFDAISQYLNYESGIRVKDTAFRKTVDTFVKRIKEEESVTFSRQQTSQFMRCLGLFMKFASERITFPKLQDAGGL